jgi:hypothetical protein
MSGTDSDEAVFRQTRLVKILSDLDRCPHGRHRIDDCLSCPGGRSVGNPHLPEPGDVVGYDHMGLPYYMPRGERPDPLSSTSNPESWRRRF